MYGTNLLQPRGVSRTCEREKTDMGTDDTAGDTHVQRPLKYIVALVCVWSWSTPGWLN